MKLSQNFSLAEYSKSNTAVRLDIDNEPDDDHLESALNLFENVIQPIRDEFGPTRITSGYRSAALNEAIGGSATSQHSKGQACDFECDGTDNKEVVEWIIDNLDFDQLILEVGYIVALRMKSLTVTKCFEH
jgi:zinc D-Ala-D-Ala carboxypeptidase